MTAQIQSFSKAALLTALRQSDFLGSSIRGTSFSGEEASEAAHDWSITETTNTLLIDPKTSRGRTVHTHREFHQELAMRLAGRNIARGARLEFANRNLITRAILALLQSAPAYTVIRLDISKYYESFNTSNITNNLRRDVGVIGHRTSSIASEFLSALKLQKISGLAPGLPLSGILAEYMMQEFDAACSQDVDIHHYYRFVDDILLICNPNASAREIVRRLSALLPLGLRMNTAKEEIRLVEEAEKTSTKHGHPAPFNYLGYAYSPKAIFAAQSNYVFQSRWREVEVDISANKIAKAKTRTVLSLLDHVKSPNNKLLITRIQCLAENFSFSDRRTAQRKRSGIYFNYPLLTGPRPQSLSELDAFLISLLFSNRTRVSKTIQKGIPISLRRRIAGISFEDGFKHRRTQHFSASTLKKIVKVWKYEN